MGHSFTAMDVGSLNQGEGKRRKVLVTGAGGRIGSYFATHRHDRYDLRLMIQFAEQEEKVQGLGEVVVGDLSDLKKLRQFCEGVDTVLHLAAIPDASATWSPLLESNIIGTYNMMTAAKAAGCRRLIFASSIHAVSGYPTDVQVKTSEPPNPGDLYGVTKAFGEVLGRYMAEQEGLSVIALRIGAFQSIEAGQQEWCANMFDAYVSDRDLIQLITKCIDNENLKFAIFHGLSNNAFKRLDISDARELVGYAPEDDCAAINPKLSGLNLANNIYGHRLSSGLQSGLREELATLEDS